MASKLTELRKELKEAHLKIENLEEEVRVLTDLLEGEETGTWVPLKDYET